MAGKVKRSCSISIIQSLESGVIYYENGPLIMPKLDTDLHVKMYRQHKKADTFMVRMKRAFSVLFGRNLYGLQWGDPETSGPLAYVRDHFLLPYVTPGKTVVEIGPGGGRWTRYMLRAKKIYAVDFHQELLDELKSRFNAKNIEFVRNNGTDFPAIPPGSVDFIFSFDAFVHFDIDIIERYLAEIKPLLNPQSNVVIHYADKRKPLAKRNVHLSENDPETMRQLVASRGYSIREEDTYSLSHSSLIRFGLKEPAH